MITASSVAGALDTTLGAQRATGGGRFHATPDARGLLFLHVDAGDTADGIAALGLLAASAMPFVRVSFGSLGTKEGRATLDRLCDGAAVLLEAGAHRLAAAHAKAHEMDVREAIALPAEELDGWSAWADRWCALVEAFGDRLWGYTEPDLGDGLARAGTRAHLEATGARPIPVATPLIDGWDTLDRVADAYDRVAIAGLDALERSDRARVLTAIEARRTRYVGADGRSTWLHYQDVVPTPELLSDPRTSSDSARWLDASRFGEVREQAALSPIGTNRLELPARRTAQTLEEPRRAGAHRAGALARTWQVMLNGYERICG